MKIFSIVAFALILLGCAHTQQTAVLTTDKATTLAMRLANDKAFALYGSRPFQDGKPARCVGQRWEWQATRPYGRAEWEARVSFAANGSSPAVEVLLLDSQTIF